MNETHLLIFKAWLLFVVAGILSLSGCDPVRTINQDITIAVTNEKGRPVQEAKIKARESWSSFKLESFNNGVSWDNRELWERLPWLEGMTNAKGKTVLTFSQTTLDGTRGSEPPKERDAVSNSEYIVRLQVRDDDEELLIIMKPGQSSSGKWYTVAIEAIEKPRYVPTK